MAQPTQDKTRAPRSRRSPLLLRLVLAATLIYGAGFVAFALSLPAPPASPPAVTADAVVALTGDGDRLPSAVALLEQGRAKRLLITGVNKLTTKTHLKFLLHGGDAFDCCADLGFAAEDTRGNAEEAANWVKAHAYRSLIVVTAAYHMPRSLIEFSAAMPDVKLIPYPVAADAPGATPWQNLLGLQGEYVKYLASLTRVSLTNARRNT